MLGDAGHIEGVPPTSSDASRGATIESVHRSMNERSMNRASGGAMTSECECENSDCSSSFAITLEAYENVRASGRRFVVAPGHQHHDEAIVLTGRLFLVIEKQGLQARLAEDLNPR
jgi:hypothetical protein